MFSQVIIHFLTNSFKNTVENGHYCIILGQHILHYLCPSFSGNNNQYHFRMKWPEWMKFHLLGVFIFLVHKNAKRYFWDVLRNVEDKKIRRLIKNKPECFIWEIWIRSIHFETKGKAGHEGWLYKQFFPRKTLFLVGNICLISSLTFHIGWFYVQHLWTRK